MVHYRQQTKLQKFAEIIPQKLSQLFQEYKNTEIFKVLVFYVTVGIVIATRVWFVNQQAYLYIAGAIIVVVFSWWISNSN